MRRTPIRSQRRAHNTAPVDGRPHLAGAECSLSTRTAPLVPRDTKDDEGTTPMDRTLETPATAPADAATHRDRGCLVAGCPCKDARIVSLRRARFFAALARERGETANRVVPADPAWSIPVPAAVAADVPAAVPAMVRPSRFAAFLLDA